MGEPTLLTLELLITVACLIFAEALGRNRGLAGFEAKLGRLAAHKRAAILTVAFTPVAVRLALLPVLPIPAPVDLEEFAHFLQSDTYAAGRLTNPPHPMAEHLETFQELMRPTYCSFRPPGHALFMAVGQMLFGHPWAGVVLSVAAFGAALCWMLQAWTSPGWAFFGSILCSCWYGIFGFWMNSYWGGAPAAAGGCLVLGALPRIKASPKLRDALWFSMGASLMLLTRTYEALFVLLPAGVWLAVWLIRSKGAAVKQKVQSVVAPIAVAMSLFIAWSLYYNWRTVGDPFITPYQVGRNLYNMAAPFVFQKPNLNLHYRFQAMRDFFQGWEMETYNMYPAGLTLPLLLIPAVMRYRRVRLPAAILALTAPGLAIETWSPPYYYAPVMGALIILMVTALRLSTARRSRGRRTGPVFVRGAAFACAMTILLAVGITVTRTPVTGEFAYHWISRDGRMDARVLTERELEAIPGRHLVIVRYRLDHNPHLEWVWNRADIDHSRVVWARAMDQEKDAELVRYFRDRKIWVLEPDDAPFRLVPAAGMLEPSATAKAFQVAGSKKLF